MVNERDFRLGFWFALLVARSMGNTIKLGAVYDQLRCLARGELTLMPSPEEVKQDAEALFGRPLTEQEQTLMRESIPTNRAEQDANNREYAALILRLMGQPMW